jgi:hypothetical protein
LPFSATINSGSTALWLENQGGTAIQGHSTKTGSGTTYGGYFKSTTDSGRGMYARADGVTGRAVVGEATSTGAGTAYGGYFTCDTTTGRGVYGWATSLGDTRNYGGYFAASGQQGIGAYGSASGLDGIGIYGVVGGQNGIGVFGKTLYPTGDGTTYAGYFESVTPNGTGLKATATNGIALHGQTTGTLAWAIRGEAVGAAGVGAGYFTASGSAAPALKAMATGGNAVGVYAFATGTGGIGLVASGTSLAARFSGNVRIYESDGVTSVMELGTGLDYAEGFDVADETSVAPGTVLVIDPAHPGELATSRAAYDRKVAGIVAGANGLGSGVRLGCEQFDLDVALAGRVYCSVDATKEAVQPGDLLTTSDLPGHAMKVVDRERAQGAILGKAMQPLEKGRKGQILVLVTLQ